MTYHSHEIESAYQEAINFTKSHYENFPVISFLLPKEIRKDVAVIYQFARQADDIADEGDLSPDERLKQLEEYRNSLIQSLEGNPSNKFWEALAKTIKDKKLTSSNFLKLLTAFEQDVTKNRYNDFKELQNYCDNSANPVGRIILELHGIFDTEAIQYSDSVCTALQLTNFYQDVSIDIQKNRIYIPNNELQNFGITENVFLLKEINVNFIHLMQFQIERAEKLFDDGSNLLTKLPWRLKRQIAWTIKGGEAILTKIRNNNFDVLNFRPTLSKKDFIKLLFGIN
ncbi:MAG: squalene synthase HpnC [Melioribacteraceae bacterium]|nr:squalene synthase HpnC [Melioribacteraceae bacterium]